MVLAKELEVGLGSITELDVSPSKMEDEKLVSVEDELRSDIEVVVETETFEGGDKVGAIV